MIGQQVSISQTLSQKAWSYCKSTKNFNQICVDWPIDPKNSSHCRQVVVVCVTKVQNETSSVIEGDC